MADMLVKLYDVRADPTRAGALAADGVRITRVLAPDAHRVRDFVATSIADHWPGESKQSWVAECEAALANHPTTCFVAVRDRAVIGFACYDATAKGFFGPMGVLRHEQRKGIGAALLRTALLAMWDDGYGYAVIGWPSGEAIPFYVATVGATPIDGSTPGIYGRMVGA